MKKFFRTLVLLLVVIGLVSFVFVGCGQQQPTSTEQQGGQQQQQTQAEPKLKVGLVFDIGGRGDKSFNDSAYNGLKMAAEKLGGYIKDDPDNINYGNNIEIKYMEPKQGGSDREQLLRKLAEEGYDLVIGVGFAFTDAIKKVAADFPNVHFGIIDSCSDDMPDNVTCLLFK